jgi:hypothetical protein
LTAIRPSPENDKLYRPVNADDPAVKALAESIRQHGILEPLVITADGYILSGHRRYVAAKLAGLTEVPCRVVEVRRDADPDAFLVALREHNRQREKSFDEKAREAVVSTTPEAAYQSLIEERRKASQVTAETLVLREGKGRATITAAKMPFLNRINAVLDYLREYWPVSERQIHYNLLNDPPLIHASKPGSAYANDRESSKALSELCTRGRLVGLIPCEAIADETRPVTLWQCHREAGAFVTAQTDGFLKGYWRDLLQSQPNHVELLVEKNTVANILRDVAMRYCLPITSGRGYCSLPPRIAIANRYRKSGKEKLVLVIASDFDPDGEEIAHSFARSMRDDFHIADVVAIKAALTKEQVDRLALPSSVEMKEKGANFPRFVATYGHEQKPYELEAMPPDVLKREVQRVIDNVIDVAAFNRELEAEKRDAASIQALRKTVLAELKDYQLEGAV